MSPKKPKLEAPPDGYISLVEFCNKYGVNPSNMSKDLRAEKLIGQKINVQRTRNGVFLNSLEAKWYVLDAPPKRHHRIATKKPFQRKPKKKNPAQERESTDEGRKELLKTKYLPLFIEKAPIEKMRWTQNELAELFEVHFSMITKFEKWGLKRHEIDKEGFKLGPNKYYFTRTDIHEFLSGEKGTEKTIDSMPEEYGSKHYRQEEGYYIYQKDKVYPKDGEGLIAWAKDNVLREDKRKNKWVKFIPLAYPQIEFFHKALELRPDGTYKNKIIVACRPRGDFKSFDIIVLFLFRLFNLPREKIMLSANSKDQVKFVHFDEATEIVKHSPRLWNVPGLDVQAKKIRLMSGKKDEYSYIEPMPSMSSIRSNITCATFSEIFRMNDEKHWTELYGSIRGVPDAMALVDSTVAPKGHILARLYDSYQKGRNPKLYFQFYCKKHYNPEMTEEELESIKSDMLPNEYAKFFDNTWESAAFSMFTQQHIAEIGYVGAR